MKKLKDYSKFVSNGADIRVVENSEKPSKDDEK